MPYGTDDDLIGVSNIEQCNVAGTAERNDEFAHECAFTSLSATKRAVCQ